MTTRDLTPEERAILEHLTDGDFEGSAAARTQISTARHAGQWSPGDPSFHILTDGVCPRMDVEDGIFLPSDRPVLTESGSPNGGVMLWVRNGRIDDFEYYCYDEVDRRLPTIDQITTWEDPRVLG
ncbi:hypothetical protein JOE59_001892 [Agromyces cerinus]|uniref:hypothetical protein n=1 Tax=Agromyces cerinus TaxID=33878 RepID=UPI00195A08F1|nr:hypothetical protein [Agromyces cerinus]MBM7831187.1 hypothetical protein [Agromyces cerinus]